MKRIIIGWSLRIQFNTYIPIKNRVKNGFTLLRLVGCIKWGCRGMLCLRFLYFIAVFYVESIKKLEENGGILFADRELFC